MSNVICNYLCSCWRKCIMALKHNVKKITFMEIISLIKNRTCNNFYSAEFEWFDRLVWKKMCMEFMLSMAKKTERVPTNQQIVYWSLPRTGICWKSQRWRNQWITNYHPSLLKVQAQAKKWGMTFESFHKAAEAAAAARTATEFASPDYLRSLATTLCDRKDEHLNWPA